MNSRMIGHTSRSQQDRERDPIKIEPCVREELRSLLFNPHMRGVGYSEFIDRAIRIARDEIGAREEIMALTRRNHYHADPNEFHHDCKACHANGLSDEQLRADLFEGD